MTEAAEITPTGESERRVGQVIGDKYSIERLLGEGDRKETYLARDTQFRDRWVALSIIKQDAIAQDPGGTQREADALTSIGAHNHIVRFYDAVTNGKLQYIVCEYLSGGTLADLVTRRREEGEGLSREQILTFASQLAKALSHIHNEGVIHRDVSPHNVWLDRVGKGRLGDFDSAIFADAQERVRPMTTGRFASPEDLDGRHIDSRSDLYSLGRVIAFLATGELGDERARIDTRSERPDLPSSLHDLIARLTAEEPDDRPPNADNVLRELQEALLGRDVQSLIAAGEGEYVEFKSSFCYPEGLDRVPPERRTARLMELLPILERSALKTIDGFLNSKGGTLLIGVDDEGNVVGIEQDFPLVGKRKHDADDWQLHFKNRALETLGPDVWSCITLSLERIGAHTVARVDCAARPLPTWLRTGANHEFFIRTASATEALSGPAQLRYILETGRARVEGT